MSNFGDANNENEDLVEVGNTGFFIVPGTYGPYHNKPNFGITPNIGKKTFYLNLPYDVPEGPPPTGPPTTGPPGYPIPPVDEYKCVQELIVEGAYYCGYISFLHNDGVRVANSLPAINMFVTITICCKCVPLDWAPPEGKDEELRSPHTAKSSNYFDSNDPQWADPSEGSQTQMRPSFPTFTGPGGDPGNPLMRIFRYTRYKEIGPCPDPYQSPADESECNQGVKFNINRLYGLNPRDLPHPGKGALCLGIGDVGSDTATLGGNPADYSSPPDSVEQSRNKELKQLLDKYILNMLPDTCTKDWKNKFKKDFKSKKNWAKMFPDFNSLEASPQLLNAPSPLDIELSRRFGADIIDCD
jgi:hypothetical protein